MRRAHKGYSISRELNTWAGQKNPSWCVSVHYLGVKRRRRFKVKEEGEAWGRDEVDRIRRDGSEGDYLDKVDRVDSLDARRILGESMELREAAKELAEAWRLMGGIRGREFLTALEDAGRGREKLKGRASVGEAVAFWVLHHPEGGGVTLGELAREFAAEQRRKGNGDRHRQSIEQQMGALCDFFGEGRAVAEITTEELKGFLEVRRAGGLADSSINHWITTMKSAFKFAAEEFGLAVNAAERLKKSKVVRDGGEFLTVEDAEKILRAAEEMGAEAAAATAILFFAGVRPAELSGKYKARKEDGTAGGEILGGLTWDAVRMEDGIIRLDKRVTKTTQTRLVPISENLAAWLAAYGAGREGRVVKNPQAWKTMRQRIEARAGVKWGQDWARHSFATYHFALHGDRNALEAAMGHGESSTVLENHYKGLASKAEAVRFWGIMPRGAEKSAAAKGKKSAAGRKR